MNDTANEPDQQEPLGYELSAVLAEAGFRHAFFTRRGGASTGPFRSLSFSLAVGDDPDHVEENHRKAGALLGVDAERILYLSQVHGSAAHFYGDARPRPTTITLEGDAIGGSHVEQAYGVRSADCVPILVADQQSGRVMAIHAGWRGVVAGVVEAGVRCLRQSGASDGALLAAVGPHISRDAFEVSEEVAGELTRACPAEARERAVLRVPGGAKPHVDLRLIVTEKLRALGLAAPQIDQVGGCTWTDSSRYFSFRRDGKRSGRHLSAIVPRR